MQHMKMKKSKEKVQKADAVLLLHVESLVQTSPLSSRFNRKSPSHQEDHKVFLCSPFLSCFITEGKGGTTPASEYEPSG